MSHDPDNIHLPAMPLPPELPPDEGCTGEGRGRGHTYTASEVKVLTETAGEAGRRIGWKTAGEEIQEALEALAAYSRNMPVRSNILYEAAEVARDIASQPPGAAPDATSGVPESSEVGSESQAVSNRLPQEPCGHPTCPCAEGNTP